MSVVAAATACAAMGLAGGAGYSAYLSIERLRRLTRHKNQVAVRGDADGPARGAVSAVDGKVLDLLRREMVAAESGSAPAMHGMLARSAWFQRNIAFSGLQGSVSCLGFCLLRMKLAAAGLAAGAALGLTVSAPLATVLGLVGCACGFTAPKRALRHRIEWRARQMEQHLPEMLDVLAIGMRSGLSFDRSVQIYASRFDTMLAREFALAQRKWTSGLERRDEALRQLAATYSSLVFTRVMESIARALRFGTSMVDSLEAAAREARVTYRAMRQEQVAKAPVKMMVPTGTLILPAMLIMVLGPVLLEMVGGGF